MNIHAMLMSLFVALSATFLLILAMFIPVVGFGLIFFSLWILWFLACKEEY